MGQLGVGAGHEVREGGRGGPVEVEEQLPHGYPRDLRRLGEFRRPAWSGRAPWLDSPEAQDAAILARGTALKSSTWPLHIPSRSASSDSAATSASRRRSRRSW